MYTQYHIYIYSTMRLRVSTDVSGDTQIHEIQIICYTSGNQYDNGDSLGYTYVLSKYKLLILIT